VPRCIAAASPPMSRVIAPRNHHLFLPPWSYLTDQRGARLITGQDM
jgi:hypothetical protein